MYIISESIQKLETEQCTNIDELKNKVQIVHTLTDEDLTRSLKAAFSYAEQFMARKLQRHLIQVQVLLPAGEDGTFYMRWGSCVLDYVTVNGDRLEHIKDYRVKLNKVQFSARSEERIITLQYTCGFSTARGQHQIPDEVIQGILMFAGTLHQTKTDATSEPLKRAAICSTNLLSPYRLRM
ncbi:hypothetical protein J4G57_05345 [Aeromonas caviae]|uniref:hypothetical protein n=1 Tax=Aeromonas TaxID=642 RepID=UPI000F791FA3|nr:MULTISPECIES: hypothetical protein [Aeromonas]MBS4707318.1 hypothetical protein [Aeromonas caviae]RSM32283.1 hypothetical protein C5B78_00955 [Aeromonas salmonicida]